jgi:SnoaL-like domain
MTPADETAIQKIALYYARGVDALGNEGSIPKALAYLRRGFTEDCAFRYYWPDGTSFGSMTGVAAFAEFALDFMRQKEYRNTQHCVSNFLVQVVDDSRATLESYVVARHFKKDNSQDLATAYYEDEIVNVGGTWKCQVRKCVQLSFDNFAPEYSLT